MKKTLKPILSILLAFAMLLPMAGVVRADDPTQVALTLSAASDTIYYHSAHAVPTGKNTTTVSITNFPNDSSLSAENIAWTVTEGATIAPATDKRSATVTANSPTADSTITVTAQITDNSTVKATGSTTIALKIDKATVSITGVGSSDVSLRVGETAQLGTPTETWLSGYTPTTAPTFSYASSNATVAEVSTTGLITARAAGTATITVSSSTANSTAKEVTVTVGTVNNTNMNVTATAYIGTSSYPSGLYNSVGSSIAAQISSYFNSVYNATPGNNAELRLTPASDSSLYGTMTGIATVNNLFSDLSNGTLVFTPKGIGDYKCSYVLTDGYMADGTTPRTISGTITIKVTSQSVDIYIPVAHSQYGYAFSGVSANGSTGTTIIASALGVTPASIKFLKNATGTSYGALYSENNGLRLGGDTDQTVSYSAIGSVFFLPLSTTGTYGIGYQALDSAGTAVRSGTIYLVIGNGDLNVTATINATYNNSAIRGYTFSESTVTSTGASDDSIASKMRAKLGSNYGSTTAAGLYVSFDVSNASTTAGTLYYSSSARALYSSDKVSYSNLGNLYFVPTQIGGTYTVKYYVYNTDSTTASPLASGTLTIYVNSVLGNADFSYETTYGKTVKLNEADFTAFLQKKLGTAATLTYVTFNIQDGAGTFYCGTEKVTFSSTGSVPYYASSNTAAPAGARYLSNVSFTAPSSSAGYTAVRFSAYSTTGTQSVTGVFHIHYTAAAVPVITYNTYGTTAITLRESDFISAYKTAMNVTTANPTFTIRFETIPSYGVLVRTVGSGANNRTQLTNANLNSYYFTVGSTSSVLSVGVVSYEPMAAFTAYNLPDEVSYVAYASGSDKPLYKGTIQFRRTEPKTVSAAAEGVDFTLNDFYNAGDSDPVIYVMFKTPSTGKLYVTNSGRLVPVTESTKLYTADPTFGDYPVSMLHYIPRVAQTTPVTLTYMVYTKNGGGYTNTITVNCTSKSVSAKFPDVTGTVGSWSANSVDFASKYGFVKGNEKGEFMPNNTMKRCDLLLILFRMAGSPVVNTPTPYTDLPVESTNSYTQEIHASMRWAYVNHILDGVVSGTQCNPNGAITRQDYATILYNYTKAMGVSVANSGSLANYVDKDKVASYAVDALTWAVANGYITSMEADRLVLSPDTAATRAQIVTLLHRYLTY